MIASDSFVRRGGGNHEFLSLLMQEGNFPFVYKISPGNLEQDKGLLCKFLNFPHVIHHLHVPCPGGYNVILNSKWQSGHSIVINQAAQFPFSSGFSTFSSAMIILQIDTITFPFFSGGFVNRREDL